MIVLLLSPASRPRAQEPQPRQPAVAWSSSTYVRAVLAASPQVAGSREDLSEADASLRSRFARAYFPALTLSGTLTPAQLAPGARFTFGTWRASANDLDLVPGVSWNLFNGFKDTLDVRASRLDREISEQSLHAERQSQALRALRTYYGLLLRDQLLEVARENLKAQRQQYELTLAQYRHGMKSLSDLLKTETDWRTSELNLQTAEAERRLALFRFNVLIEDDEDAEVSFAGDLSLDTTDFPLLEEGLRRALLDRPELRRNRLQLDRADVSYRRSTLDAWPSLALDFDLTHPYAVLYEQRAGPFGVGSTQYGFTLRLSLPSSFNVYSQAKDVEAARARWRRSRHDHEALRRSIREEVYESYLGLLRAVRSYQISVRKEEISRQNLDLVYEQYEQGSADVIRLSQAQLDYVNARTERMRAFHDASLGRAAYLQSIGEPIWR